MTDRHAGLERDLGSPLEHTVSSFDAIAQPTKEETSTCVMPVPNGAPKPNFHHRDYGEPSRVWPYHDVSGGLIGYIARYDPPGQKKQFVPHTLRRVDGRLRWYRAKWPGKQPLYGLDRLAAQPAASVVITEGEKAADAAQKVFADRVVITSPNGARAAKAADWSPLAGRQVMIWPDNDAPGRDYARDVEREVTIVGVEGVTIVDAMRVAGVLPCGEHRSPPERWDAASGLDEDGWQPEALAALVLQHINRVDAAPNYTSFGRFHMSSDGLTAEVTKGQGEDATTARTWISAAFEIVGRARDPHGQGWGRRLRWRDEDGRSHDYVVADAALHGEPGAVAAELAARGLIVARSERSLLCDYLNRARVKARVTTVNRTGWHEIGENPAFVLPDEAIGQPETEKIILTGGAAAPYGRRGTREEWREGIGRLTAGHGRLVLAMSMAFAGPLLYIVGAEGGGIHIYGPSSSGKTTLEKCVASVWGPGAINPGFVQSWRATPNAYEGMAALVTDTLLIIDEVGSTEGRDAGAAVYQLSSGVGKGRSARDGSLSVTATWRVLILSSGELPMAAKIAEDKQRRAYAGQAVRLLDLPADAGRNFGVFDWAGPDGDPARLAEALETAALSAYGEAGPAFVRALMNLGLEKARSFIDEFVKGFVAEHVPAGADRQIRRAAGRLGLIAAAGELARAFEIVPWAEGEADAAAARALADWIGSRGGTGPAEVREAIAQVRRFFEAYGESWFEPADQFEARPVPNRAGWRRGQGDERIWLVLPQMWRSEVCAGLDPVLTARILAEHGMLKRDPTGKFQRSERTPSGVKRVYTVNANILEGESDAL